MALKFNPGFQTEEQAVASFVVRRYEFETIIDALTVSAASPEHSPRILMIAPRGAGKTTLCRRVWAEIRLSEALSAAWQPVFLGEESYGVTTPGEFFLECLFQLKEQVNDLTLRESYSQASAVQEGKEDLLLNMTIQALRSFCGAEKKRLLIIVENFHVILNQQMASDSGPAILLEKLNDESIFGVLATCVVQPSEDGDVLAACIKQPSQDGKDNKEKRYLPIELKPLSLAECRELWESLTGVAVDPKKLRPLQILTGGSPRMIHILADFMKTPSLHNLMTNLNHLIDQNTEYFKSQLDSLPAVERKVFASLLDLWAPSSAKQVADQARVKTNIASAMLARLVDRGAAIQEPGQGRTAIYYAAERLFNIYYLMRRRSHPSSRVRALVTFMMGYYEGEELIDTAAQLMKEACAMEPTHRDDYHATFDALMSRSPKPIREKILALMPEELITSFRESQRLSRSLSGVSQRHAYIGSDDSFIADLIERIEKAADHADVDLAYRLIKQGLDERPEMLELWMRLSITEHYLKNYAEAVAAAEKAVSLEPTEPWPRALLGRALNSADRADEAEESFKKSLELDPGQPLALTELAATYERRGEQARAEQLFVSADGSGALKDFTRAKYGKLLDRLGRNEDAERVLRVGSEAFDEVLSRRTLVEHLSARKREGEGAELLRSVAAKSERWEAWADLGAFLLHRTSDVERAREAIRAAIDRGADRPIIYAELARAVAQTGGSKDEVAAVAIELVEKLTDRADAWIHAGLIYEEIDDLREAEVAYRAALEREDGKSAVIHLATMLQKQIDRRAEAETILRAAVASTNGRRKCVPSRELAEQLIHDGNDTAATDVIKAALEANDRCACCLILDAEILERRNDRDSSIAAYRKALDLKQSDITALVGLSRLVSGKEAADLLARAKSLDPDDPRVLLAQARLRDNAEAQIRDATAALNAEPTYVEARLFLAQVAAKMGDMGRAVEHISDSLHELPLQKDMISSFVGASMAIASRDNGIQLSRMLEQHDCKQVVEPVLVALQLLRGENPLVAKEIRDVAFDIVMRHRSTFAQRQQASIGAET